jgi:hypothetical protein
MRPRTITQNGTTYALDRNHFFYEPIDPPNQYYPGLVILALAIATWAGVIGIGYCSYRALEMLAS